jgi:hypothetical protein
MWPDGSREESSSRAVSRPFNSTRIKRPRAVIVNAFHLPTARDSKNGAGASL